MPAKNIDTFELDLTKQHGLMRALYLGQGDKNGTTLVATITDNGELPEGISGMVPYFEMLLPDGKSYYESPAGTLTVADGVATATVQIDEQYAARVPGITDTAYIALKSGSTVIASTERVRVVVLRNAADGAEPSEAWSNGIEEAVARANAAAAAAEGVVLQAVPTMSATVKGGAKLGTGLEVNNDTLSLAQDVRYSISSNGMTMASEAGIDDCDAMLSGTNGRMTFWMVASNTNNMPLPSQPSWLYSFRLNANRALQVCLAINGTVFIRRKNNSVWGAWTQLEVVS